MTEVLGLLGAEVVPCLADRFDGGYGVSERGDGAHPRARPDPPRHVRLRHERPRPPGARPAAGVDVIVIDHHRVPEEPLPVLAFLNPHRPDCAFPYKGLASVGLALTLAAGVRAELGVTLDVRRWLDLVALGTIADVAPLDGDNRPLVRAGLGVLAQATRPGIAALAAVTQTRGGLHRRGRRVPVRAAHQCPRPARQARRSRSRSCSRRATPRRGRSPSACSTSASKELLERAVLAEALAASRPGARRVSPSSSSASRAGTRASSASSPGGSRRALESQPSSSASTEHGARLGARPRGLPRLRRARAREATRSSGSAVTRPRRASTSSSRSSRRCASCSPRPAPTLGAGAGRPAELDGDALLDAGDRPADVLARPRALRALRPGQPGAARRRRDARVRQARAVRRGTCSSSSTRRAARYEASASTWRHRPARRRDACTSMGKLRQRHVPRRRRRRAHASMPCRSRSHLAVTRSRGFSERRREGRGSSVAVASSHAKLSTETKTRWARRSSATRT